MHQYFASIPNWLRSRHFRGLQLAATRLHLARLIRHLALGIRYRAFAIRHPASLIPHSEFRLPQLAKCIERPLKLPDLGRLVPPQPLEPGAQLESRAIGPVGVRDHCDGLVARQQLVEVLDLVVDDRVEDLPRLGRVAGAGNDLTPGAGGG